MGSQLKSGIYLSYILIIINNVIKLAYTPFLIRSLGPSEYGLYSIAAATVGYMAVMDLGFGNAIIRYTSKYLALNDFDKVNKLHGMFLSIYFVIGVIVATLGVTLYYFSDMIFDAAMSSDELEKMKTLILFLSFNLAITFPFSIFGSIIIANEKFIFSKVVSICIVLLNPLIMIPLLLMGYKSIALVMVMTIVNILMLLSNLIYCYKKLKISPNYFFFDSSLFKDIFAYSFFIFLNAIVDQLYWSSGQFILGSVSGTTAVAIYSVALTFKGLYFAVSSAAVSILLPKVTKMVTIKNNIDELSDFFTKIGRLQFLMLSLILTLFILFGQKFVVLWAGEIYKEAYYISLWIMIPVTIPLMQNLGITILQAQNKQKFRSIVFLCIATSGIIASIYLSKIYGGLGCAIATGICLLIGNGLIMNIYYQKKIGLDIINFWKQILKSAIPIIITASVFFYLKNYIVNSKHIIVYLAEVLIYILSFSIIVWCFVMNMYEKQIIQNFLLKLKKR